MRTVLIGKVMHMAAGAIALAVVMLTATPVQAEIIETVAYWSFNNGNDIVDVGSGTMSAITGIGSPDMYVFGEQPGTTVNAQFGYPAGDAAQVGRNQSFQGSSIQWEIDMTGRWDLTMSWAERKANDFGSYSGNEMYWRVGDSGSFTLLDTYDITTSWSAYTADFSSVSAINGQPLVQIRYTIWREQNNDWNSFNVMDNVLFTATIPEPASGILLGLAGLVFLRRRGGGQAQRG